ncbi:MAG: thiol reductase thioredoxin [Gammaproteobacteria bacterium]|nr:thiol reductase thioredoxin [Gammaproteobacteria bacterium]
MIHELTAQNFDAILDQHDTVVIDFWAPWCQPCLAFKPIFSRVAEQFPKVCFASVNVEAEKELGADFNVRQIPLIMILRQRVALFSEAGTLTQSALADLVQQALDLDMSALQAELKHEDESKGS